ncbi:hypothetical protein [Morganella morganii]|uniref:hypothetical protein n=1 Tax=Morganella morganii TaxID=582 RepID=UPI00301CA830
MNYEDPRSCIFSFIEGLPTTIRSTELITLLLLIKPDFTITGNEDENNFLNDAAGLLERTGYAGLGMIIFFKTLISRNMNNAMFKLDKAELGLKMLKQKNPELSNQLLVQKPLQRKHYESAIKKWNALLAGPLCDANIEYLSNNPCMTLTTIQLRNHG